MLPCAAAAYASAFDTSGDCVELIPSIWVNWTVLSSQHNLAAISAPTSSRVQSPNVAIYAHPCFSIPHCYDAKSLRSEEHTSELQSLMRISYAVFCLNKTYNYNDHTRNKKSNHN